MSKKQLLALEETLRDLVRESRQQEAQEVFAAALRRRPGDGDIYAAYAKALLGAGLFTVAAPFLEEGLGHAPDSFPLLYLMGQVDENRGGNLSAFDLYARADAVADTASRKKAIGQALERIKTGVVCSVQIEGDHYSVVMEGNTQQIALRYDLPELNLRRALLDSVLPVIDPKAKTVLEIECGAGIVGKNLAGHGFKVSGVSALEEDILRATVFEQVEMLRMTGYPSPDYACLDLDAGAAGTLDKFDVIMVLSTGADWYQQRGPEETAALLKLLQEKARKQLFFYLPAANGAVFNAAMLEGLAGVEGLTGSEEPVGPGVRDGLEGVTESEGPAGSGGKSGVEGLTRPEGSAGPGNKDVVKGLEGRDRPGSRDGVEGLKRPGKKMASKSGAGSGNGSGAEEGDETGNRTGNRNICGVGVDAGNGTGNDNGFMIGAGGDAVGPGPSSGPGPGSVDQTGEVKLCAVIGGAGNLYRIDRRQAGAGDLSRVLPCNLAVAGSRSLIFTVEVEQCRSLNGFAYTETGWNHFTAALQEAQENPALTYGESILKRFFERFQPRNRQEHLFGTGTGAVASARDPLQSPPSMPPLDGGFTLLPWMETKGRPVNSPQAPEVRGGNHHFGPNDDHYGEQEYTLLKNTVAMLRAYGYRPEIFPDGYIQGYLLKDGTDYRFLVSEGQHRMAATGLLGEKTIKVRFDLNWLPIIDRAKLKKWPQVKSGLYSEKLAEKVFEYYFEEDGRRKAKALGLL